MPWGRSVRKYEYILEDSQGFFAVVLFGSNLYSSTELSRHLLHLFLSPSFLCTSGIFICMKFARRLLYNPCRIGPANCGPNSSIHFMRDAVLKYTEIQENTQAGRRSARNPPPPPFQNIALLCYLCV